MSNEAAGRLPKWTFLYDDYERGTVFITDDPTGEQKPLVSGITEDEALAVLAALAAERRATVETVRTRVIDITNSCQGQLVYDAGLVQKILDEVAK